VKLTTNLRRMPEVTIQQARLAMQFQRIEHKLAHRLETQKHRLHIHNPIDVEKLRAQLAHEAEAFRNTLAEWAKVRDEWYSDAKERLAKLGEQARREHANFKAHSREVIERLHMQHRRLALMHAQLA
jgi:hypothetical protein